MLVCAYYCAFGTRDRGCQSAPGFPCALCLKRANEFAKLGRNRAARMRAHALSPRRPGERRDPYAAAEIVRARWWTALLQQQPPVIMGPGLRRDDGVGAAVALAPRQTDPHCLTIKPELCRAKVSRLNPRFSARSSPRADTLLASLAIAEEGRRHGTPGFSQICLRCCSRCGRVRCERAGRTADAAVAERRCKAPHQSGCPARRHLGR